tara:strand:+ start:1254 stop:2411 length:1158 start_codon:yes stop_codon:yes gene_type:complete
MIHIPFGKQLSTDIIVEIIFNSCNQDLKCKLLDTTNSGDWWGIYSSNLPVRYVCLRNTNALKKFVNRYGYMDKNNCVNYKSGIFGVIRNQQHNVKNEIVKSIVKKYYVHGIPQRASNSGLCWYSAMCFCCFFCTQMKNIIKYYSKDAKLNNLIETCLNNPKDAETLRHHLYYMYNLGDNPKQSPEKDGQNGFSEFIILCAKLNIPIVRLFAPNLSEFNQDIPDKKNNMLRIQKPSNNKPSLLVVRCFRTKWKAKPIIIHKGRKYKLVSVLIGSEHCGHQIGASTCDLNIGKWACADADAQKEGIGPIYWKVKYGKYEQNSEFIDKWWDIFGKIIPVTLFNSGSFCDFSPHNRSTCALNATMNKNTLQCNTFNAGVVNSDFVYIHV